MPARGPSSPSSQPAKRQRQNSVDDGSPRNGQPSPQDRDRERLQTDGASAASTTASPTVTAKAGQSSNFRNVSACNRCRLRKNRCDQKLPSCASCAKAGVACVGYDPITKKEIPRRYDKGIDSARRPPRYVKTALVAGLVSRATEVLERRMSRC